MYTFPKSGIEFQNRFRTEQDCIDELVRMRWPNGFRCPNCEHDVGYQLSRRRLIQCAVCHHQSSVTSGTIFHKTHLPLLCWFWIIYQVSVDKGGTSVMRLASQLNRPYKTVWYVLQKIRHAMGRRDDGIRLAGLIELDEAVLDPEARRTVASDEDNDDSHRSKRPKKKPYGRKPGPGRKRKTVTEVLVMVEAERFHAGNVSMDTVKELSFKSIQEYVHHRVEGDQWFRADAHHSHWGLRFCSEKYSIHKSSTATGCEVPVVHRVINLLKHFLRGTYFGVSTKYLPGYLNEFCFRFMRREHEDRLPEAF
jgi:ISXO2-like transposase domain/Transposase zinc-ribbon domain